MSIRQRFSIVRPAILLFWVYGAAGFAQHAELRPARPIRLPGVSDSNSPVHWRNGKIAIFQSMGLPLVSSGDRQTSTLKARAVSINSSHLPLWIEATWVDEDGTLYAWYHHEQWLCNPLAVPKIGALVSYDGGYSFTDLGII
ncbi:MAG: hypothetical protein ACRD88_20365, partial [Terriglobia bacterium]